MRIVESANELERRIEHAGKRVAALSAGDAVAFVRSFFASVRATDAEACSNEALGDGLMYQWGVYDWGVGEFFEFDLTRQFAMVGEQGDDALYQLHLTLKYPPSEPLRQIKAGNLWCFSVDELSSFEGFIVSSDSFLAVASLTPISVALNLGKV